MVEGGHARRVHVYSCAMAFASGTKRRTPITTLAVLLVLAPIASSAGTAPPASTQPVKRYTIRAEIVRLPRKVGEYLTLHHEALDSFTSETGEVVGMDSMVMPFPLDKGVSLEGLAAGDKIEAVMVVDWAEGYMQLEHIRKLPRTTVLHFGKAHRPPKAR